MTPEGMRGKGARVYIPSGGTLIIKAENPSSILIMILIYRTILVKY